MIFFVIISLMSLDGSLSSNFRLPALKLAHANTQACQTTGASGACSEFWYPAGPEMNTELVTVFTDETAEYNSLQSASPSIDLTDWPMTQSLVTPLTTSPNFLVSAPISAHSYFEIEFMLANNFWGVNFNYGTDPNGIQIRQGISHLTDKVKFVTNDPHIGGGGSALDNPLPPSNGGLPTANPCGWDVSFPESGTGCVVGATGGTAYHLALAAGVNFAWQPALGSPDFCAAAQHFVNAGLASAMSSPTCVLTGISSSAASHTVNFFVRSDDPARLDLGNGLAQEICALFGQGFVTSCAPYLQTIAGPITAFPGFTTSPTSVNLNWGMYTAGFLNVYPFDSSLYFGYNSRFVSGIPSIKSPSGVCSSQAVPTFSASNYMYLCSSSYDGITTQMEFAPCVSAVGDPLPGSTSNGPGGNCPGTSKLSAVSAGIQAENLFGQAAYTIPIFTTSQQYAYLSNWSRVVNNDGLGVPNYFTWLNAYSPNPAQPGTVRQGFKQSTRSLDPYIASTAWDFYILGNIYDTLTAVNPLSNNQVLDWMTTNIVKLSNSGLGYSPPPGTVSSFRFTLRNDLYWQDGRQVTPWDVKFSYLTLQATGAYQGSVLAPVAGVTIVSQSQFDINVNAVGPFTVLSLTSVSIFPGRYWSTCPGSLWDGYVSTGNVPSSCIQADPNKIVATYDPLVNGILIGSGPWVCKSATGVVGAACSSTGFMNPGPGGSYTLQRFGKGIAPGTSTTGAYFRSAGNLALWIWSEQNNISPEIIFSIVAACYGQPVVPLGGVPTPSSCAHFQQGIGASGGPTVVGLNQVSIELRFYGLEWVGPYNWVNTPPIGIASLSPVLYEGITLNPASVAGCSSAYPSGGYDC
jgi:hypothetical protein